RTVAALAGSLAAVAGAERGTLERVATVVDFVTFFELLVETPVEARIGIALSRDPLPEGGTRIGIEELYGVTIVPRVELSMGSLTGAAAAALSVGAILPIPRKSGFRGSLRVGGRTLAEGTCGILNGRFAFMMTGGGR
ncbi:MAG: FliM/FliN family flagellar motor switch protein, partial [Candidatus Eremiobacteraeota bacterium]|nr:FliM/FliN family flagellar motor switch protein [Candidatus Eremiobacteraeota bacterium]